MTDFIYQSMVGCRLWLLPPCGVGRINSSRVFDEHFLDYLPISFAIPPIYLVVVNKNFDFSLITLTCK